MREFNTVAPVRSLYHKRQKSWRRPTSPTTDRLVNVIAYCLNPNHFHFIVEPLVEGGLSEFMKRLSGGYTKYFNERYNRSGSLFQGKYKYIPVEDDEYLKYLSVYVNLNDKIHQYSNWQSVSSYKQYKEEKEKAYFYNVECKHTVLSLFTSKDEYVAYAEGVVPEIIARREEIKDL